MIKYTQVLLIILVCFSFLPAQDNNYVPGELIVMLNSNVSAQSVTNYYTTANLRIKEPLVEWMNIWLFEFDYSRISQEVILSEIRKHTGVAIAQSNHYITERSYSPLIFPNDTRFSEQWALNNTGQTGGTVDADIDAPEAWNIITGGYTATGDSIIVAVVDGGFYLTHPDLKYWINYAEIPGNSIDDDSNGYVDDYYGWNAINNTGNITGNTHGSHVSGIAGALGNNNLGVCGVNWNVKIMAVQGSSTQEAVVVRAYGYVLKQRRIYDQTNGQRGAFVVSTNSSFGVNYGQPANYPLWCAFYDSLGTKGILNACATANLNINVDIQGDIPTACPSEWMVSVTNTRHDDTKNPGAAYGQLTIDLGAPGTNILSTYTSGNYSLMTGTSMATPHVAGAIALMYAGASPQFIQAYKQNPGTISLIVKQRLLASVDTIPALQNITVSNGRLNIYKALLLMQLPVSNPKVTSVIPARFNLYQNYPNPFNPLTIISYDIPTKSLVTLKVFDILGREVAILINGVKDAGNYEVTFDAGKLSSGVYFYKLESQGYSKVLKMSVIK
jgi:subtilisin family serine protease